MNYFNVIVRILLLYGFVLGLMVNCSSSLKGVENRPQKDQFMKKGIYEKKLVLKNGEELRYAVSLPSTRRDTAFPLILALHYGGEVTPYYGKGYLQLLPEPAFRELNAIILAPDCPGRDWADSKSENAVLELIDFAKKTWPIDGARVIITGFSMGGMGAWYLSGRYPELFCAAIPVAARPIGDIQTKIPVFIVHGKQDEIINYKHAADAAEELKTQGIPVKLILVDGLSHYQTQAYVEPVRKAVSWLRELWRYQN
jgi:predicted peptidase